MRREARPPTRPPHSPGGPADRRALPAIPYEAAAVGLALWVILAPTSRTGARELSSQPQVIQPIASDTTFADVPADYWAYAYIEELFQRGYIVGCQLQPRLYCPDATMTRAESAVLVVRGVHGGGFLPPQPLRTPFSDVLPSEWFAKWAAQLWDDGYTAGCGTDPLIFCPYSRHTRAEATVFFERIIHGRDYLPVEPASLPYEDVARGAWYSKWVAAAHADGLTEGCEDPSNQGDRRFRPQEELTRAEAACMMARAKDKVPQGWGEIHVITQHPNLYYNQSEIDELRRMILVDRSPQRLVDLYESQIRGATAAVAPNPWSGEWPACYSQGLGVGRQNMRAAISYMIEPSEAKAQAIRDAILSFVEIKDRGAQYGCQGVFVGGHEQGFTGYSLPWLYDLLLAYHPQLVAERSAEIEAWFAEAARAAMYLSTDRDPSNVQERYGHTITYEGMSIGDYPNWFSFWMGSQLAMALVSGDQSLADFWADSGWPHDLLTVDGVTQTSPPLTANRYDLVMHLLATFPSGANWDTYTREGWDPATRTISNSGDGGYHTFQMEGVLFAAEAAYHNGLNAFVITDQGEPAILRFHRFTIGLRGVTHRDGSPAPGLGYDTDVWFGVRRYNDPALEAAALTSYGSQHTTADFTEFFGYPRRWVNVP